jgi:hypothetical protein
LALIASLADDWLQLEMIKVSFLPESSWAKSGKLAGRTISVELPALFLNNGTWSTLNGLDPILRDEAGKMMRRGKMLNTHDSCDKQEKGPDESC